MLQWRGNAMTTCAMLAVAITGCAPVGPVALGPAGAGPARPAPMGALPAPPRARLASAIRPDRSVPTGGHPYFHTLPPGAKLPSGSQCARWVRARSIRENKRMNRRYNRTTGQHVGRHFFRGDKPQAQRLLAPRITGDFTGTTQQILRWAACKWGIDQNIVYAQAAVESWWRQTTKGDWHASGCPPGHGPGVDGRPGLCPQSWGILQNRYPYEKSSWPGIERSTAMNADAAYAIWRACFDGYETWLATVRHVGRYRAGKAWACVGRWFAGRWQTPPAERYIATVRKYLRERIWTKSYFQEP